MPGVSDRIQMAYELKELFYEMMASENEQQARKRYKLFIQHAIQANLKAFNKHINNNKSVVAGSFLVSQHLTATSLWKCTTTKQKY